MELVTEILRNIHFDDKFTSDEEAYGIYRVDTAVGCVEFVKLYKEIPYAPHIHDKCSAQFIFLMGSGKVILGDEELPYVKGSVFNVPAGVMHGFKIVEDTIFLSIQSHPIQDRETGVIDIRYE